MRKMFLHCSKKSLFTPRCIDGLAWMLIPGVLVVFSIALLGIWTEVVVYFYDMTVESAMPHYLDPLYMAGLSRVYRMGFVFLLVFGLVNIMLIPIGFVRGVHLLYKKKNPLHRSERGKSTSRRRKPAQA